MNKTETLMMQQSAHAYEDFWSEENSEGEENYSVN
jgi:hypothetical protein